MLIVILESSGTFAVSNCNLIKKLTGYLIYFYNPGARPYAIDNLTYI